MRGAPPRLEGDSGAAETLMPSVSASDPSKAFSQQ
jgi:hypothetical protein